MHLISIDPGVRECGIAVWENSLLAHACMVRSDYDKKGKNYALAAIHIARAVRVDLRSRLFVRNFDGVAIEKPRIHAPGKSKKRARPEDIIHLAMSAGAIVASISAERVYEYLPHEHKGEVPKPEKAADTYIIETRARRRLSLMEQENIELPSARGEAHNVWDAVWIGLNCLGRT